MTTNKKETKETAVLEQPEVETEVDERTTDEKLQDLMTDDEYQDLMKIREKRSTKRTKENIKNRAEAMVAEGGKYFTLYQQAVSIADVAEQKVTDIWKKALNESEASFK